MRLPVNQDGERIFDDNINKLVVIANESYEEFAEKLQTEYEEDCGITFGQLVEGAFVNMVYTDANGNDETITPEESVKIHTMLKEQEMIDESGKLTTKFTPETSGFTLDVPKEFEGITDEIIERIKDFRIEQHVVRHGGRKRVTLNKRVYLDEDFKKLWNKIKTRTTYSVNYDSQMLIDESIVYVNGMPSINEPRVKYIKADFTIDERGVTASEVRNQKIEMESKPLLPDILNYIQRETKLRRKTIAEILIKSERLEDFSKNPQQFMDQVVEAINSQLNKVVKEGIEYEKIKGEYYEMNKFEDGEFTAYLSDLFESRKSVYTDIELDSSIEENFAKALEQREDIKLYVKLPRWFIIDTPVGGYNPDWAIVKEDRKKIYFVRETKGTEYLSKLRGIEELKVKYGKKHFEALGVDFDVAKDARNI